MEPIAENAVDKREEIKNKLRESFDGKIVRKDLTKKIKEGANVPVYVLEFLLGQYCSSDDDSVIEQGVQNVKWILADNFVRPDESQRVLSKLRKKGSYTVIDMITARLDMKRNIYIASFSNLGIDNVLLEDEYSEKFDRLLCGGIWCIVQLDYEYVEEEKKNGMPVQIRKLTPIQMPHVEIDELKEGRKRFTEDEWLDIMMRSIGMEPDTLSKREKWLLLLRMVPLVENNFNLCELDPRSTGKSHLYKEISPNSILVSGGQTTVANLFYNMGRKAEFLRELRKEQYGDALDEYFPLGRNLNQRDTIAVRKMVGGLVKLMYPDGEYTKEQLEEILKVSLEMRRRVKEQLKKLGGMEFYDVNFSYIDLEDMSEHYVSVPEQGGGKLIPEGLCNPGQVDTVLQGKSGMIGVFRLEGQMLPGNGKLERTGLGSDLDAKESSNTAFNYLKANGNRISGSISTTSKDYIINYQDLQGIGMTGKLALPTLIALCSIALGRPVQSSTAILGEISISGTLIKVDNLADTLQVCLDSGAKKVLLPQTSFTAFATVPPELMSAFQLIPYQSAEDAVFKALGVE